ncbi:site-specific integrase [Pseudomonas laurylsulfativorans]|uniref:site-specific integrase n=1 Tax=Pseudomonas laurylsulfativorans TaxID=1943631 RepID=UPI000D527C69|nr:site-specific integrase [Pseudomonas laurylsulfativorans]
MKNSHKHYNKIQAFEEITVYHQKTQLTFNVGPTLTIRHESLRRNGHIEFEPMRKYLEFEIIESFRNELCSRIAESYSLSSIESYCTKLNELCRKLEKISLLQKKIIRKINQTNELWSTFIEWLNNNRNIKSFLVACNGEDGVLWSDEYNLAIDMISSANYRRLSSVRAADPTNGALTEFEVRDVTFAICSGYEKGLLQLEHLAVFFLALVLGYRQSQILNIKLDDLTYSETQKNWILKIEILKQRLKSKSIYRNIRLPPLVNTLINHMIPICRNRNRTYLIHKSVGVAGFLIPEEKIKELPDIPCDASVIMTRLKNVVYNLGVRSDRVIGGKINLNFIRFKHTLLTRAAVNGASVHELMFLGLHSDASSASSYIDSIPESQARIKEELGPALASIANLFLGGPYEGGYERAIMEMPDSIQRHYGIAQAKPIGVCGSMANCTDHAPVACLLCSKFEPFRDAPFGEYKQYLIHEHQNQPDIKVKKTVMEYIDACDMWISKLSIK